MALSKLDPTSSVALSECDREPVHIPGAIQPHGLFFILDHDLKIRGTGDNTRDLLGLTARETIGTDICTLATLADGTDLATVLRRADLEQHNPLAIRLCGAAYDAIAHRHDGRFILECEPERALDPRFSSSYLYNRLSSGLVRIRESQGLEALYDQAAREIRNLTGFDRVLIYKFRPDLTGEVVAEAGEEARYLGLRFPASDIPVQARALYLACRLRMIPTSTYAPARLVWLDDGRPVDLTHATLRSISPVHLQYMKNMGVTASMGLSLIEDGRLWGLVTCNHESGDWFVPYRGRAACALIGEVVSSLIGQRTATAHAHHQLEALSTSTTLTQFVARDRDVARGLTTHTPSLADVASSTGAALFYNGELHVVGRVPEQQDILRLVSWLGERDQPTLVFDSLPAHYPPAHAWKQVGCGLVASRIRTTLTGDRQTWVLWFRPELAQTVAWGGNPNKPTTSGVLSPRSSFEQWKETVELMSAPFQELELEAVRIFEEALTDAILEVEARQQIERSGRLVEEANRALKAQIEETQRAELELRRAQKLEAVGRLASGIAHEINTPLQYIADSVTFVKDALEELAPLMPGAPACTEEVDVADLAALFGRLPRAIERALEGLTRVSTLVRAMKEFAHPDGRAKELADLNRAITATSEIANAEVRGIAKLSLDLGPLPEVACFVGDFNQVVLNLVVNAAHAIADARGDSHADGTIAIRSWHEGDSVFITVADDGSGIPEAIRENIFLPFFTTKEVGRGTGQGLAIAHSIVVDKHGGSLTFDSEVGRGTTFEIRLPIAGGGTAVQP